jgi:hypothetical protein
MTVIVLDNRAALASSESLFVTLILVVPELQRVCILYVCAEVLAGESKKLPHKSVVATSPIKNALMELGRDPAAVPPPIAVAPRNNCKKPREVEGARATLYVTRILLVALDGVMLIVKSVISTNDVLVVVKGSTFVKLKTCNTFPPAKSNLLANVSLRSAAASTSPAVKSSLTAIVFPS